MNPILKNVCAAFLGLIIGSVVNIALVNMGPKIIPLPEGADVTSMEALKETMHLFKPENFLFPFLGHSLGTLAGAFIAAKLAFSHKLKFGIGIGCFYLLGGIFASQSIGGPTWFVITDLVVAYVPMGYLGGILALPKQVVSE